MGENFSSDIKKVEKIYNKIILMKKVEKEIGEEKMLTEERINRLSEIYQKYNYCELCQSCGIRYNIKKEDEKEKNSLQCCHILDVKEFIDKNNLNLDFQIQKKEKKKKKKDEKDEKEEKGKKREEEKEEKEKEKKGKKREDEEKGEEEKEKEKKREDEEKVEEKGEEEKGAYLNHPCNILFMCPNCHFNFDKSNNNDKIKNQIKNLNEETYNIYIWKKDEINIKIKKYKLLFSFFDFITGEKFEKNKFTKKNIKFILELMEINENKCL